VIVETTVRKVVTPRESDMAGFKTLRCQFRYQKIEAVDAQSDANLLGRMRLDVQPAGDEAQIEQRAYIGRQ